MIFFFDERIQMEKKCYQIWLWEQAALGGGRPAVQVAAAALPCRITQRRNAWRGRPKHDGVIFLTSFKTFKFSQELPTSKSLCRISISNYGDVSSVL